MIAVFHGAAAAVSRQCTDLQTLASTSGSTRRNVHSEDAAAFGRLLADLGWRQADPAQLVLRASGLPSDVPLLLAQWERESARTGQQPLLRAHAGNGIVEGFWSPESGRQHGDFGRCRSHQRVDAPCSGHGRIARRDSVSTRGQGTNRRVGPVARKFPADAADQGGVRPERDTEPRPVHWEALAWPHPRVAPGPDGRVRWPRPAR